MDGGCIALGIISIVMFCIGVAFAELGKRDLRESNKTLEECLEILKEAQAVMKQEAAA
jgi:hypothetical protein